MPVGALLCLFGGFLIWGYRPTVPLPTFLLAISSRTYFCFQSLSPDVRLYVSPSWKPQFLTVLWLNGLLLILAVGRTYFLKAFLWFFLLLSIILNFRVFANQPTVHNGGVSKGRALAVGVTGDMLHMTRDMLNMTLDTFFSFLPWFVLNYYSPNQKKIMLFWC